ncbi:MAG: hypothetical protein AAF441_28455 [Pseudomonadota bacterium]
MLRSGYAMKKIEPAEEQFQLDKPEQGQVSPEVNEVLHMLEALQSRCTKEFGRK